MKGIKEILHDTVIKVLTPLVRILLSQGMSYNEFNELARRVFVGVAEKDFVISGRKQTDSRISVITGINRKEVNQLRKSFYSDFKPEAKYMNRTERVVHGWLADPEYIDQDGKAIILDHNNEQDQFAELVKKYSGDMPARAILDEMRRLGIVEELPGGKLSLLKTAFVPSNSAIDKLPLLGDCSYDFLTTLAHNMEHEDKDSKLQLKVEYPRLSPEVAADFKKLSEKKSYDLLQYLNAWLAKRIEEDRKEDHVKKENSQDHQENNNDSKETIRAGVGIYFYDEENDKNDV